MYRAWEIYQSPHEHDGRGAISFADALRRSWREAKSDERRPSAADVRAALTTRIRQMREGRVSGLTRENWKELGVLRDKLCSEMRTSV